ncbi:probable E3 ubiquitin-protein ligase makorin-2 [Protopterus annectens]|uniref:probable E3 ubiquitin-protein ligase makorin-2 n=1 Tax=Protopterus annectens TaxID=7888 RepID=UPI001CFAEC31|nr:probable E3 ubiquitin-protein ligase makorin-2 [Protopterus annectens]
MLQTMNTKQVTCRYFMHGVCREGSRCLFSHDLSASKPATICKFYLKGECAYGTRCRYDHIKPSSSGGTEKFQPQGENRFFPSMSSSCSSFAKPENTATAAVNGVYSSGRNLKKTLVLRDRALCRSDDDNTKRCTANGVRESESGYSGIVEDHVEYKPQSYLEAIRSGLADPVPENPVVDSHQLCPYAAAGHCHYGDTCLYLHGDVCDICQLMVLHPFVPEQRKMHKKMCMEAFEHDMERAFAIQYSQDKVCSICMEIIYEKASTSEKRFGILSNCNHVFCLSCIRQWRCTKQFENKIIKYVYVCKKACKYFEQGKGTCPFGGNCLYLHAYPDGTIAQPEKPRKQFSSEGSVRFLNSVRLWDFIEEREHRSVPDNDDEVNELGELFMHLSGANEQSSTE